MKFYIPIHFNDLLKRSNTLLQLRLYDRGLCNISILLTVGCTGYDEVNHWPVCRYTPNRVCAPSVRRGIRRRAWVVVRAYIMFPPQFLHLYNGYMENNKTRHILQATVRLNA